MSYLFSQRHIGPDKEQIKAMLSSLGFSSLEDFIIKKSYGKMTLIRIRK